LQKRETTKLFWGEYLYKLSIINPLSPIFREKNLSNARQVLDKLQHEYEKGERLTLQLGIREKPVTEDGFLDAKKLYKFFSRFDNFKLRVENIYMAVYANDLAWINSIIKELNPRTLISLHEPNDKYLSELKPNTILVEESNGYEFKVTLGQRAGTPEFAAWAENNPKLVKMGPIAKEEHLNSGYVNGMYFYARDERTLQLCSLMLSNIRRIDKLVVKSDIDK
jgi:hypothetical protein